MSPAEEGESMRQVILSTGLILAVLVVAAGCDRSKPGGEAEKDGRPAGAETALIAPVGVAGWMGNDEGVEDYQQGQWEVAEGLFRKAIKADPQLAEAHFNLALTLDKMGRHEEATASFRRAAELAPKNPKITDSPILKEHTKGTHQDVGILR